MSEAADILTLLESLWDYDDKDDKLPGQSELFLKFARKLYEKGLHFGAVFEAAEVEEPAALEAIGANSQRMIATLDDRKKQASEHPSENTEDQNFYSYCIKELQALQKKAKELLSNSTEQCSVQERENNSAEESYGDIRDIYRKTLKLQESVEEDLELSQRYRDAAEMAKQKAELLKSAAESVMPNMLTTLGIFTAIIIAVVACYLNIIFNKESNPRPAPLNLCECILMGHILMNVMFLMVYLISKLTNYILACHCYVGNTMDCGKCPAERRKKCTIFKRVWLRYPYVVLFNFVFTAAYFILGLWYFIYSYCRDEIETALCSHIDRVLLIALILAGLFIGACVLLYKLTRWKD